MYHRYLIKVLVVFLATMAFRIANPDSCRAEGKKPNILFIVTDDQGAWTLSAQDYPNTYTPEIDRLAREGVILKNAFTMSAVSSPSRASLISGRYCSETGVLDWIRPESRKGLDTTLLTWPQLLNNAGYQTALVGKWHLGDEKHYMPTQRGYDYFTGFPHGGMRSKSPRVLVEGKWKTYKGRYTPDLLTDFTMDYIRKFQDQPFAISLHYWAPHANTDFPDNFQLPYNDRSWLPLKEADLKHWREMDLKLPNPDFPDLDTRRVKRMMREYYASVHSVDRNIGRIMDFLDELNLTQNTVVIFTSDHGYMMGHHGLWHKGNGRWITRSRKDPFGLYEGGRPNLYDNSLHVPCVIRWPGVIEAGTTLDKTIT
ncbi:MAG: sulfatase-like hydrolase/transferase, partial [Bacteroidales bacterium]